MNDWYAGMRELRQERHRKWREKNLAILKTSGIDFEERPEALLFREDGKPAVDFYPSTGRWQVVRTRRMFHGGAEKFLRWYNERTRSK